MRYMSENCCNTELSCCNNNCCNTCNGYGNTVSPFGGSWFYMLAILLLFAGGGFGPSSFWGDYGKIFRCSGFNNGWCNNIGFNNFNNGIFNNSIFNTSNNGNNNFKGNNLSNVNLAGLLGGLSGNSNFNISSLTDSYN